MKKKSQPKPNKKQKVKGKEQKISRLRRNLLLVLTGLGVFFLALFFFSRVGQVDQGQEDFTFIAKDPYKKTVCLNMIVKNESPVIRKCLASVKDYIDCWVIVDTGSDDGTQAIIKEFMKDIPGKLYERPWVNFEHNRNEALALAKDKADYSLFIDADEALIASPQFVMPQLYKDVYYVVVQQKGSSDYWKNLLIRNKLDWQWKGVLHETLFSTQLETSELLKGVVNSSDTESGNRSKDPQKYMKDAAVLKKALETEPDNTRYQFYLAQCYANAQEYCLALEHYQKRAEMEGGDPEEVFWSLLRVATIKKILHMPPKVIVQSYMDAYNYRPTRSEPLYYIGAFYLLENKYELAYEVLKKGIEIPFPRDSLFVENHVYNWDMRYKFGQACYYLKRYREFQGSMQSILLSENVPENVRLEIRNNLAALNKML